MKKRHLVSVFALCGALCVTSSMRAGSSNEDDAAKSTEVVAQQQVNTDEIVSKVLEQLPKISGYVQTGYNWGDKNGDNRSSFQMKRMRLILDKKMSNMFDVRAQFEVFSGSTDASPYKKKVMTIMDAFVNTHISKALHFRAGQYYLPLGFENYDLSPATLEAVDFSNINLRMVCRNPISSPDMIDYGRDIGIMAYGDLFENKEKGFNYLSYNLSLTNGYLPTLMDDNKTKDVVARITFRPISKIRIMGSYGWGESQGLDKDGNTKKYLPLHRMIFGAWYSDPNGLTLRSEYGHMKSSDAKVKEDGLYVLAAYKVDKFLPTVRWDMYRDKENKTSANNRDAVLVGCAYAPFNFLKFQLNYTHSIYKKEVKDAGAKSGSGNSVQVMAVAYF